MYIHIFLYIFLRSLIDNCFDVTSFKPEPSNRPLRKRGPDKMSSEGQTLTEVLTLIPEQEHIHIFFYLHLFEKPHCYFLSCNYRTELKVLKKKGLILTVRINMDEQDHINCVLICIWYISHPTWSIKTCCYIMWWTHYKSPPNPVWIKRSLEIFKNIIAHHNTKRSTACTLFTSVVCTCLFCVIELHCCPKKPSVSCTVAQRERLFLLFINVDTRVYSETTAKTNSSDHFHV